MLWRGLAFAFCMMAAPIFASERIACVQSQLASLGYDIGVIDGQIQPQTRTATRAAFRDIGEHTKLILPFDDRRAGQWCRQLGLSNVDLQAAWPSQNAVHIYTDQFENALKQAMLSKAEATARQFFKDQFGISLAGSFALIGTENPEHVNPLLNTALAERGVRPRKSPLDFEKICQGRKIGAAANREFITMCWQKPGAYNSAWANQISPRLTAILVHEFMHQTQYELAIDIPARRLSNNKDWLLGPSWMIEGSAEVVEEIFQNADAQTSDGNTLFTMQKPARRARVLLSDLNKSGAVNDSADYGTARFAAYILAQKHGVQSLFDYFRALGDTEDRDAAFRQVFGQSLGSFEVEFETVRRDFGTARNYIKKGSP